MNMLDRYKKKGGFIQLLNLIETTAKEKAEKFLKLIAEESPAWETEIRRKVLTIDRLATWNQTYLMEVLPRHPANVLATAFSNLAPEKQQIFLNSLPFGERRKTENFLKEITPSAGEVASCQMKLLNEVRSMIAVGALKFEKVDPEMVIPENIEELLNNSNVHLEIIRDLTPEGDGHAMLQAVPAQGVPAPVNQSGPTMGTHAAGPSFGSQASATAPVSPGNSQEEVLQLRRRVMALTQENQSLKTQLQSLNQKMEQIRKAAA